MQLFHPIVVSLSLLIIVVDAAKSSNNALALSKVLKNSRRIVNLSSLFGSARHTAKTPYERVGNYPVFQVTTSWGSPYMSFDSDIDEEEEAATAVGIGSTKKSYRPTALFYMDADDAKSMRHEMLNMKNLAKADIRITATTLSKAIRQASNLGNGLPTGAPVDPFTGKLPAIDDGGSLRYKIVPSKRQLFYAARCKGRESVGLCSETSGESAKNVILNLVDSRKLSKTAMQKFPHMSNKHGIPVFYSPSLQRKLPKIKGFLGGTSAENPVFFSYEDLVSTWDKLRRKDKKIPRSPPDVEVMSLMDILTSMDREALRQSVPINHLDPIGTIRDQMTGVRTALKKRFSAPAAPDLDAISFIPEGNAVEFKEHLAAEGNGKARLRPMKEWREYKWRSYM